MIAGLLQHKDAIAAVQTSEVLSLLGRGILEYLLQQVSWILQDGSTLWGRNCLASVLKRRSPRTAAAEISEETGKPNDDPGSHLSSIAIANSRSRYRHLDGRPRTDCLVRILLLLWFILFGLSNAERC